MSTLVPVLIGWLQQYGYPALWLSIFVASIGIPLPITLVLLGAGAIATIGDFNIILLLLIASSASITGDTVGYLLGRRLGSRALLWLEHKQRLPFLAPQAVKQSRIYFQERGGWAIFFSRFLFSALGGPINLLAGAELYPYRRFLLYDASGEFLGACIPLTLGFIFGSSWEAIGDILGVSSLLVLTILLSIYLSVLLIKLALRMRATRHSRHLSAIKAKEQVTSAKTDALPL